MDWLIIPPKSFTIIISFHFLVIEFTCGPDIIKTKGFFHILCLLLGSGCTALNKPEFVPALLSYNQAPHAAVDDTAVNSETPISRILTE